jgi:hypothetical protein
MTDSDERTSAFAENVTVNCIKLGPLYLIPIWVGIIGICGVLGIFIRRRSPASSRLLVPGSFAFGALLGGGLFLLGSSLPNVIIDFTPEQPVPYSGQPLPCNDYLDPSAITPQDGALIPWSSDVQLEWTPAGSLPEGEIRWRVEAIEIGVAAGMADTQATSLLLSELGLIPQAGSEYTWSLIGKQLLPDGENWLTFCANQDPWSFSIEAETEAETEPEEEESAETAPTSTPEPTEEACTTPLITALMNMTCRKGPDQAYEEAGYLLTGETAVPEGVSMDTFWYWIPNPDWLGYCFVAGNGVEAECVEGLPPIASPPLPTVTEPVCLPDFDAETCSNAGGTWRATTAGPGYCECP